MPAVSAGLLLYRRSGDGVEVLLVHPGGPFFRHRDEGWWTVPKGLAGSPARICSSRRSGSSSRRPALTPPVGVLLPRSRHRAPEGRQGRSRVGGRGRLRPGANCAATPSAWSGRHARGRCATSPRSIAAAFFTLEEARRKILVPSRPPLLDRLTESGLSYEPLSIPEGSTSSGHHRFGEQPHRTLGVRAATSLKLTWSEAISKPPMISS